MAIRTLLLGLLPLVSLQLSAERFPASFLEQLPHEPFRRNDQLEQLVGHMEKLDQPAQRVPLLNQVTQLTPIAPALDRRIRRILERTLDAADATLLASLGMAVARYPDLYPRLLKAIEDPAQQDRLRSQIAQLSDDYDAASRLCRQIKSPQIRRNVHYQLAFRADELDEKLRQIDQLLALPLERDSYTYSVFYCLRLYAAQSPMTICDAIDSRVPAESAIAMYANFAHASRENLAAAHAYLDSAWSRVAKLESPYKHVPLLLRRDFRLDRKAWVERFDRFVLPALKAGKTEIGPLSDLARFDIQLMIDRTRQSCAHPARRFEKIFPYVLSKAFGLAPDEVLDWLEHTESDLKDQCVLEIVETLATAEHYKAADRRPELERVCALALAVEQPAERLAALSDVATGLHWLRVDVPEPVLREGRALLKDQVDFASITLNQMQRRELFWLATAAQQQQFLKLQMANLRAADEYQEQMGYVALCRYVSESRLTAEERLGLFREMADIAVDLENRYLQSRVASSAVRLDAGWAVKTIWRTLPADRGRSGKRRYIDWTPPPYDAGDAIAWLKSPESVTSEGEEAKLMEALWQFLPAAPPVDRDSIRLAICQSLVERRHYDAALGVLLQIADTAQQAEGRIRLLR